MSSKRLALVAALFMIMSMLLSACGTETATSTAVVAPATATTAPVAATATVAPAPPTATTAPVAPTATTAAAPTNTVMAAVSPTASTMVTGTSSTTDTLYAAADCAYGGIMKSIEAVDASTVKFTLCNPDPAFPSKIAFASLEIQSAAHLEATGGAPLDNPIGTGAYVVSEWVRGDHLTLTANPNYWGEAPANKTLIFRWNAEATARYNALTSGEADAIDNPDANDFAAIQADTNLNLLPREALSTLYLGLNNVKPPFDNEKVRQAIAMAIDRASIVTKFYPPGSSAADYFTPCGIPGGCEGDAWYSYDVDAAKALLTEAGFPNGFDTRLAYRDVVRGYLPVPPRIAEEIQAQLKLIGVNATIDVQESGTFLDNASAGNLEMFLLGWGADYPDATNFLDYHFGVGANDSFGTKFSDITDLLTQAASISDQAQRNALYAQVNTLIKQHVPMVPIAHGGSAVVYSAAVTGAHTSPIGNETFRVVAVPGKDTFVWIQNAEPISLYCGDETDGESLRACEQIFDPLLSYKIGGTEPEPALATAVTANDDLTEWTATLRPGVTFSDGTPLTATDVVVTYAAQWDVAHPLHVGRAGTFDYWTGLFAAFLNAP